MSQIFKDTNSSPAPDIEFVQGDSGLPVGPDPATFTIDLLGAPDISVAGTPGTFTLQLTDLTKFTPYVVGPVGQSRFQTIQAAINAANAAGGGLVFIWNGTYNEDLTLFDNIQLFGDSEFGTTIIGSHTIPAAGKVNIFRINFESAGDIFISGAAGTTKIIIENCTLNATNGYSFNLPNFMVPASLILSNIKGIGANDGGIYNTGGMAVNASQVILGTGIANPMTLSGVTFFDTGITITCPINFVGAATLASLSNFYANTITFAGTSHADFFNDTIITGANPCIVQSSTGAIFFATCILLSFSDPAIDGIGTGIITFSNTSLPGNNKVQPLLNKGTFNGATYDSFSAVELGTAQTAGAVTADPIIIDLGPRTANYSFDILFSALENGGAAAATYEVVGGVRTNGIAATLIDVPDFTVIEDAPLATADIDLLAIGNTAVIRVTGVAATNISWSVRANYIYIGLPT
jgi:hypothetical protein